MWRSKSSGWHATYEVHVYSNRVEDIDLSRIVWHHVPALPGPHLFAYGWWFLANHLWRWWDRRFRGLRPALVYSPGINCFDADLISVHVVFGEFETQVGEEPAFEQGSASLLAQTDSSQDLLPAYYGTGGTDIYQAATNDCLCFRPGGARNLTPISTGA